MKFAIIDNSSVRIFNEDYVIDKANGRQYIHPTEEQLRKCGYKELIVTECTLEEKEGYSIVPCYSEDADTITQTWEYEPIPMEEYYDELPTA